MKIARAVSTNYVRASECVTAVYHSMLNNNEKNSLVTKNDDDEQTKRMNKFSSKKPNNVS